MLGLVTKCVSIPNGMEFYLSCSAATKSSSRVSIPNGMEFYERDLNPDFGVIRFQFPTGWNSTMFATRAKNIIFRLVSIPNGMEFYGRQRVCVRVFFRVSIPNGMEFYCAYNFFS